MKTVLIRCLGLVLLLVAFAAPIAAQEPPVRDPTLPTTDPQSPRPSLPPAPKQQGGFLPVDELPPTEDLPAAPLLVGAYVFVWVALFGYLISVAKRIGVVQREVERLERDIKRTGGRT